MIIRVKTIVNEHCDRLHLVQNLWQNIQSISILKCPSWTERGRHCRPYGKAVGSNSDLNISSASHDSPMLLSGKVNRNQSSSSIVLKRGKNGGAGMTIQHPGFDNGL